MQPVPDPSEPTIHPDQAADNTRRSADLLRAMIECGHEIALLIHQEAVATAARNAAEPNLPRLGRYTRVADFAGPYEKIFRGVRRFHPQQHQQARPDGAAHFSGDRDAGLGDSLNDGSHRRL